MGAPHDLLSRPTRKNISLFRISDFQYFAAHPASTQGAYRDRHDTRGGLRWTWRCCQTCGIDTDGEIVWSRRPDAGVKSRAGCKGVLRDDGGKQALAHQGERV